MTADPARVAEGAHALVHGLGRFGGGQEATRFLRRRGCEVRVDSGYVLSTDNATPFSMCGFV